MKDVILITGGCRCGKSRYALELADAFGKDKIFIATCTPFDSEMKARVRQHQNERDLDWKTIEAPLKVARTIKKHSTCADVILLDCITLWISNLIYENDDTKIIQNSIQMLSTALAGSACPVIVVSNEVGTGIVPQNHLARQYRDMVGIANQTIAKAATKVIWMVAGIPVCIKPDAALRKN